MCNTASQDRAFSMSVLSKKIRKKSKFCKLKKKTENTTHHLRMVYKMCKIEMDPASILENREQTWFHPEGQIDGQVESIPHF